MEFSQLYQNLDFKGIFAEYIVHNSLDKAIAYCNEQVNAFSKQRVLSEKHNEQDGKVPLKTITIKIDKASLEESIGRLLVDTFNRTKDTELDNPKNVVDCYVDPHFFQSQKRFQTEARSAKRLLIKDIFRNHEHNLIILGDLGSGKTTLIKKICQNLFIKDKKYYSTPTFPILIRLRELNSFSPIHPELTLFEFILQQLGFSIDAEPPVEDRQLAGVKSSSYFYSIKRAVCEFLDELKSVILFDGFDEIHSKTLQHALINDLEIISTAFHISRFIITSRPIEFNYSVLNTQMYEIAPLDKDQVKEFIDKYIVGDERIKEFTTQLYATPYFDTSKKPLALAHLCAIYERTESLPSKPKSVYKRIVSLYIEEWDIKRRIDRKKKGEELSEYNKLPNDRKEEFISKMAFLLTANNYRKFTFSESDILKAFNQFSDEFELPFSQAGLIVREIEGHSGLIIQTSNDSFEFAHPSLQEYLCAQYISKMGNFDLPKKTLMSIPNELAITLALVSEPNALLCHLVFDKLDDIAEHIKFINVLLHRIIIEKPDFKIEPRIGLIVAHIYSMIKFKGNILSKGYYSDAEIQDTVDLLKQLVRESSVIQKSLQLIMYDYVDFKNYEHTSDERYKSERFKILQKINNISDVPKSNQPTFLAMFNL